VGFQRTPTRRSLQEKETAPKVWATLRDIIQSQLQIPKEDIREEAHFQNDLGAD